MSEPLVIGAPTLHIRADVKGWRCERCRALAHDLHGVNRRRLGARRKAGWAMVCATCFDALGRPDDPVTWR